MTPFTFRSSISYVSCVTMTIDADFYHVSRCKDARNYVAKRPTVSFRYRSLGHRIPMLLQILHTRKDHP
jgi:hypothetical protein